MAELSSSSAPDPPTKVHQITPTPEELGAPVRTNLPCSVPGCTRIFKHSSALRFHLEKVHKVAEKKKVPDVIPTDCSCIQYHCPQVGCPYHIKQETGRHFKNLKYLRQHYLNIHAEKKFQCTTCQKAFSIESALRVHLSECGTVYSCTECTSTFDTWRSYLTHCNRFKHRAQDNLNPNKPKKDNAKKKLPKTAAECTSGDQTTSRSVQGKLDPPTKKSPGKLHVPKPILPCPDFMIMTYNVVESTEKTVDNSGAEVQAAPKAVPSQVIYISDTRQHKNPVKLSTTKSVNPKHSKKLHKQHSARGDQNPSRSQSTTVGDVTATEKTSMSTAATQTQVPKNECMVAQTQTTGDIILRRAMQCADIPTHRESKGSQVSPRAKLKEASISTDVQTSQTQTVRTPKLVKMQTKLQDISTTTEEEASTSYGPLQSVDQGFTLSIPEESWSSVTHTQTQTLLNELQASLGESISTQTLESYLHDGQGNPITQNMDILPENMDQLPGFPQTGGVTVDQAVLCDLDFNSDLIQPQSLNTRSMACSPILMMPGIETMETGTDPPFTDHDSLLLSQNISASNNAVQTDMSFDIRGTQTTMDSLDFPELLTSGVQTSDFDPVYMNIQTQTGNDGNEMIDEFLSNMETQTTDPFFAGFSFSDIETQTPLHMLSSSPYDINSTPRQTIETQTSLQTPAHPNEGTVSMDMQTQTRFDGMDVSPDLADSYTQTAFSELESFMNNLG